MVNLRLEILRLLISMTLRVVARNNVKGDSGIRKRSAAGATFVFASNG